MQGYAWPGNVRELANAIERAVVMSTGNVIFAEDLPSSVRQAGEQLESNCSEQKSLKKLVRDFEAKVIAQTRNARNQGNRSRTATELGISRRALLYKLHELNLDEKSA